MKCERKTPRSAIVFLSCFALRILVVQVGVVDTPMELLAVRLSEWPRWAAMARTTVTTAACVTRIEERLAAAENEPGVGTDAATAMTLLRAVLCERWSRCSSGTVAATAATTRTPHVNRACDRRDWVRGGGRLRGNRHRLGHYHLIRPWGGVLGRSHTAESRDTKHRGEQLTPHLLHFDDPSKVGNAPLPRGSIRIGGSGGRTLSKR